MKKLILLIFPIILLAQDNYVFGPSVRVSDDTPGTHDHYMLSSGQHLIGCHGDTVYLVWSDERITPRAVYFSRSTDGGNSWSANLRLSSDSTHLDGATPSLVIDEHGNIFVCYGQYNQSTFNVDVYFTKSTDGGLNFTTPILVNDTTEEAQDYPSIAVDSSGQKIFIAWRDARNPVDPPNFDIYMSKSTDGGLNFLPSVRVDDTGVDSSDQDSPSIGCTRSGDTVYVVWQDERNQNGIDCYNVYFSRSIDGGMTFEPDILVDDTVGITQCTQRNPSLWFGNTGDVYVVWEDNRQYGYHIYFDKSIDGGVSFNQDIKVTDDTTAGKVSASITSDDSGNIYVVWRDLRQFSQYGYDIYFSFSSDGGNTFNPNVMVNDLGGIESAWDWYPSICVNESCKVFVAWESDRNDASHANSDIYCATGQYVGIEEQTSKIPSDNFIQLFPNPFQHVLMIKYGGEIEKIEIFDILGRRVKDVDVKNEVLLRIDVKDLSSGVYFVKVISGNNAVLRKVIKVQ